MPLYSFEFARLDPLLKYPLIGYYIHMFEKIITVGVNASYLRKPETGIGQVTANFLRELTCLDNKQLKFILYLEEDIPDYFGLPEYLASSASEFEKRIFLPAYKRDDLIRKIWWEKHLLPKRVKKDRCDIFISLYQCPTILDKKIKHLMFVHDIIPKLFPEYLNNSRKRAYWNLVENGIHQADKIIAISKRTEKDLVQHLAIRPEVITTEYIDIDEIYKKEVSDKKSAAVLKKYSLKPGYILAGGGLEARKNIEGVIRTYKILRDRNKNLRFIHEMPGLVIYGKLMPSLAPLITDAEKIAKELNLSEHIILLDNVAQKDLPAIFQNAIIFIYPSFYEGFGLPILEAMNAGTPVITSKTSSLPEVGRDAVLYCDPKDNEDIAMVIKNLLVKPELRQTLSRRGKERAKMFSWDKFTKKVLHICLNH